MKILVKKSFYEEYFSKSHKYISRWKKNNRWEYKYPSDQKRDNSRRKAKLEIARETPLITGCELIPKNATTRDIEKELDKIKTLSIQNKLICPALGNSKIHINKKSFRHIFYAKGTKRTEEVAREKSMYLRYIPEILKKGKISEKSYSGRGLVYGIICRASVEGKEIALEVAICYDKEQKKCYLSIASETKKALTSSAFFVARSMLSTSQKDSQAAVSQSNLNISQYMDLSRI